MCLIHSRSEVCATANILAQSTRDTFDRRYIDLYSTSGRHLQASKDLGLAMLSSEINNFHIRCFSDASFASNNDSISHLRYTSWLYSIRPTEPQKKARYALCYRRGDFCVCCLCYQAIFPQSVTTTQLWCCSVLNCRATRNSEGSHWGK